MKWIGSLLIVLSGSVWAQGPAMLESKYFCKLEEFVPRKGKAALLKKCDALIEKDDKPTTTGEECKSHGLAIGRKCIEMTKLEKIAIKLKFTEKFGANANYQMWTCELDNAGGSACP